jgi:predicted ATPase
MSAQTYFPEISVPRLQPLGGNFWNLSGMSPVTVLFGKNGSGKSLFLRGWRDLHPEEIHYVIPERTGEISFEPSYLQQQIDTKQRQEQGRRNFLREYRQHILARVQAYFIARGASHTQQLEGDPTVLEQLLAMLLPDFAVELVGKNPPYALKRLANDESVGGIDELSSGEAQLLTLGLDILTMAGIWEIQKPAKRLLLIDEPDAHIHPDLQVRFADFIIQVADKFSLQIVVATHSTTLLSALGQFGADQCGIVYFDRIHSDFVPQPFTTALKEIAACLGGHALMGPLFGAPILLVEGDDDYRIWSQVPRHHVTSFSVIPCHGEEIYTYQAALEKVFAALRENTGTPAGFALLDGDKSLPGASAGQPQNHIKFIKLDCHEAENLYLTDEVLQQIGTNWTDAANAIEAAAPSHGSKAGVLLNAQHWNRMNEDLKEVIAEVSLAIDQKHVHWTQRVGVSLGRIKPTEQLATFLGPAVIAELWP